VGVRASRRHGVLTNPSVYNDEMIGCWTLPPLLACTHASRESKSLGKSNPDSNIIESYNYDYQRLRTLY
jgi:hypothetical protein